MNDYDSIYIAGRKHEWWYDTNGQVCCYVISGKIMFGKRPEKFRIVKDELPKVEMTLFKEGWK